MPANFNQVMWVSLVLFLLVGNVCTANKQDGSDKKDENKGSKEAATSVVEVTVDSKDSQDIDRADKDSKDTKIEEREDAKETKDVERSDRKDTKQFNRGAPFKEADRGPDTGTFIEAHIGPDGELYIETPEKELDRDIPYFETENIPNREVYRDIGHGNYRDADRRPGRGSYREESNRQEYSQPYRGNDRPGRGSHRDESNRQEYSQPYRENKGDYRQSYREEGRRDYRQVGLFKDQVRSKFRNSYRNEGRGEYSQGYKSEGKDESRNAYRAADRRPDRGIKHYHRGNDAKSKYPDNFPEHITIHIREPKALGLFRRLFKKKRQPEIPFHLYANAHVLPDLYGNYLGPPYPYRLPPRPPGVQIGDVLKEPTGGFENILDDMIQSAGLPSFMERPYLQRPSKSATDGLFPLISIRKLFSVPFSISSDPHSLLGFRLRIPYIASHKS